MGQEPGLDPTTHMAPQQGSAWTQRVPGTEGDLRGRLLVQPLTFQRLRAIFQGVQGHKASEWKIQGQNPSLLFQNTRKQMFSHCG